MYFQTGLAFKNEKEDEDSTEQQNNRESIELQKYADGVDKELALHGGHVTTSQIFDVFDTILHRNHFKFIDFAIRLSKFLRSNFNFSSILFNRFSNENVILRFQKQNRFRRYCSTDGTMELFDIILGSCRKRSIDAMLLL